MDRESNAYFSKIQRNIIIGSLSVHRTDDHDFVAIFPFNLLLGYLYNLQRYKLCWK